MGPLPEVFHWVLGVSARAAVLVLVILAAQALAGRRLRPGWRWALWLLLVARLALPWAPESALSVFNAARLLAPSASTAPAADVAPPLPETSIPFAAAPPVAAPAVSAPLAADAPLPQPVDWRAGASAAWALGALALACTALVRSVAFYRRLRRHSVACGERAAALARECADAMGVQRAPEVAETALVGVPAVCGILRPQILLPEGARGLADDELRHVLLHELAHVKRRDVALNCLALALQCLHWFNPLVWYGFRRMRADRELACDEMVLSRLGADGARGYGRAIVSLCERFAARRGPAAVVGIAEGKSNLKRRIAMIAGFKPGSWKSALTAAAVFAAVALTALTSARAANDTPAAPVAERAAVPGEPVGIFDVWTTPEDITLFDGQYCRFLSAGVHINDRPIGPVPPVKVRFYVGEGEGTFVGEGGIVPQASKVVYEAHPWDAPPGAYKVRVVLVPEGGSDSDPANNSATTTVTIEKAFQFKVESSAPAAAPAKPPVSPETEEVQRKLEMRLTKFDFTAQPLEATVAFLRTADDVNIITGPSVPLDAKVTLQLENSTIRNLINLITLQQDLSWTVVGNYVFIGSPKEVADIEQRYAKGTPALTPGKGETQDVLRNLDRRLANFDFSNQPFDATVAFLRMAGQVNIVIDESVPELTKPVTLQMADARIKDILDFITQVMGLDWIVADNYVFISSKEGIEKLKETITAR